MLELGKPGSLIFLLLFFNVNLLLKRLINLLFSLRKRDRTLCNLIELHLTKGSSASHARSSGRASSSHGFVIRFGKGVVHLLVGGGVAVLVRLLLPLFVVVGPARGL